MDHFGILKRSFQVTIRNRVLWVFGILIALTGGMGSGGFRGYSFGQSDVSAKRGLSSITSLSVPPIFSDSTLGLIVLIALIALAVIFLLVIIGVIVRYVSENALIRLVDQVEEKGETGSVGHGFRLGWSRPALRIFLIDLIIGIPYAILVIFLIVIGLAPLLLLATRETALQVIGVIATIGMLLLSLGVIILLGVVIDVLTKIAYRQAAIHGKGTFESIGEAFRLIRRNLADIGLIWLLMFAVGLGWGILMIPVFIILTMIATVVGGVPAALAYMITREGIVAAIAGLPFGLITFVIPLIFLGGLMTAFVSAVWTLAFREVCARESGLAAELTSGGQESSPALS